MKKTDAELENAVAEAHATGAERAHWKARAEAADAKLKEAVEVLQAMRDHGGEDWVIDKAQSFLASMEKDK